MTPNLHKAHFVKTAEEYIAAINEGYDDVKGSKEVRAEVISILKGKENRTDAEAFELGMLYIEDIGEGAYEEAEKLGLGILESDPGRANFLLGWLYARPYYNRKRDEEAFMRLVQSMQQGYIPAFNSLGYCYDMGIGVEQNYMEGARLYLRAAEAGRAIAQFNLGNCYYFGIGVEKSFAMAAHWYREAATQKHTKALYCLGCCYYYGEGLKLDIPVAVELFKQAANAGHASACLVLGDYYASAEFEEADYEAAAHYYEMGVQLGNARCAARLARMYYEGIGVRKDISMAMDLRQKSFDWGLPDGEDILKEVKEGSDGEKPN